MPYTEKQEHFFRAVAHGWRPSKSEKGSTLSKEKAEELLEHEGKKKDARRRGQGRALSKL